MGRPASNLFRSIAHLLAAVFNERSQFDKAWQLAIPNNQGDWIATRWQGEWLSEANSHHGALRCLLHREGSNRLEARFCATYARRLRVAYRVELVSQESGAPLRLKGAADLGMLAGGIYEYDGELDRNRFECAYRCKYDHGTFRLKPFN